jgi:hypothetical protein
LTVRRQARMIRRNKGEHRAASRAIPSSFPSSPRSPSTFASPSV